MTRRERMERRLEKREGWAAGREAKAAAAFGAADRAVDGIEPGQPILVGHHSEKRHRKALDKCDSAMRRGIESQDMAGHHASKADGIRRQLRTTIYSDDPDAIENLEAKAAAIDAYCDRCKAINKQVRKGDGWEERIEPPLNDKEKAELLSAAKSQAFTGGKFKGYASYTTTNARANARRLRKRIKDITARQERQAAAEAAGGVIIKRLEAEGHDYCTVTFAEKPAREILDALRGAGFHWGGGFWSGKASALPESVEAMASDENGGQHGN